jgi:DNA-directed RNA polymerase specialized sigma24 family protein
MVDRNQALDHLAGMYAQALRLDDQGRTAADIAAELGIDEAAVDPLLRIGAHKLARVMAQDGAANAVADAECGSGLAGE